MPSCITTDLRIHGMCCAEEVTLLRRALEERSGIEKLSFDLLAGRMTVSHDANRVTISMLAKTIQDAGLESEPWSEAAAQDVSLWQQHRRMVFAAASGGCLLAGMFVRAVASEQPWYAQFAENAEELSPAAIALFTGTIVFGFAPFLRKVASSFRALRPDMNLLLAVSLAGALTLGEWMEAATLAFLFALAGILEAWSLKTARTAVTKLVTVSPKFATVIHGHGEHAMPVERVPAGELVRIKPGERIPCDGVVEAGQSAVNQLVITGEGLPTLKRQGDKVFAGTMNGDGSLDVRTTSLASDTTLARILRMVGTSSNHRAPSEQFVERFARVYTPVILVLALAVAIVPPLAGGAWSYWFYQGMVILLISCPCALVISTPVTIVSALASAARYGVLIKGGAFLEEAARIRTIAFDKTGVLTQGEPRVQSFELLNGHSRKAVLDRLLGVELRSEHPLARAIVNYARERGSEPFPVADFHALQGRGAEATIEAKPFWVGGHRLLRDRGLFGPELQSRLARLEDAEHSAVICGIGEDPWAVAGILDPVRPEAAGAIAELRKVGITTLVMLTGDNSATANAIGRQVGLTEIQAEMLPSDKAVEIERLRKSVGPVAMVGDGINDAPAMAKANLGIALGQHAADVALETADVVLTSGNLSRLPFLWKHSRRAARVIRQNVAVALCLKAAFLVLAFFGAATLWMAIAADMGATLLVTLNGLRLLRIPKSCRCSDERPPS